MDRWCNTVVVVQYDLCYKARRESALHTQACRFSLLKKEDVAQFGPGKHVSITVFSFSAQNQTHSPSKSYKHTYTHTVYGCGTFNGGVAAFDDRLNSHGLFCFLSRCLPFFLHPSWWWHWVCMNVCVCCVCTPLTACGCL